MIRAAALGLVLLACACGKTVPLGTDCSDPKECGKGADCYHGVCAPMCLNDAECTGELVCARHRCLLATGEPMRAAVVTPAPPKPEPAKPAEPAPDDPTVEPRPRPGTRGQAMLAPMPMGNDRGLEAQIEALRAEQKRLNDRIEALEKKQP